MVSFPQNHYTSYICYLQIKANNLLADNPLYLIQNVFNYGIKDTKKVRFQIDLITCASMAQNDELKQTIHRYRGVLMDAMKIFLVFFVIFSFRSLIHNQRLIFGNDSLPVTLNFQEMRITFRENSSIKF